MLRLDLSCKLLIAVTEINSQPDRKH